MNIGKEVKSILSGYGRSTRKLSALILFFLMAGVVSLVIIYPLWLFATTTPRGYTIFCGILFLGAALFWTILKIRSRRITEPGLAAGLENQTRTRNLRNRRFKTAGKVLVIILSLYLTTLILGSGYVAGGIVFFLAAFFLNGWLLYGNPGSRKGR